MGKHTKKGAQKSSVGQFGHSPDSAYSKSRKMAKAHEAYQEKATE
ncbi:hypothetical protein [Bacillus sp. 165]|nr:hypothetical protein [Bacillus sp. 165]